MININLTRWRSLRRQQHKRQLLLSITMVVALIICLTCLINIWFNQQAALFQTALDKQNHQLKQLTLSVKKISLPVKKLSTLQQQHNKVEQAILSHIQLNELLFSLNLLLPNSIKLTQLQLKSSNVKLKGVSYTSESLTTFLQQLSQHKQFERPQIHFSLNSARPRANGSGLVTKLESPESKNGITYDSHKNFELTVLFKPVSDV